MHEQVGLIRRDFEKIYASQRGMAAHGIAAELIAAKVDHKTVPPWLTAA
jgi:hypothetical protein